ncbi:MAG TPA: hypothetical protein VMZ71_03020 [Gemmataceae bacterium]|nr:hypothetical protein [Gemmataceae bacterium]
MARPASDRLHDLLAFHGIEIADPSGGELTDADLENVVGGKALRRNRDSSSQSQKPARDRENKSDLNSEKFFERQNQNTPNIRNQT